RSVEKRKSNCREASTAWESEKAIAGRLSQRGKVKKQLPGGFRSVGKPESNCREASTAWKSEKAIAGRLPQRGKVKKHLSGDFCNSAEAKHELVLPFLSAYASRLIETILRYRATR
ncbi:MAG: hypothetical protein R3Y36_06925, partial [Spirochaetales bacterium]